MTRTERSLLIWMVVIFGVITYAKSDYSLGGLTLSLVLAIMFFAPSIVMTLRNRKLTSEFLEINILLCWSIFSGLILLILSFYWKRLGFIQQPQTIRRSNIVRFSARLAFVLMVLSIFVSPLLFVFLFTFEPQHNSWFDNDLVGFLGNMGFAWPLSAIGVALFWKEYKPWV